MKDILIINFKEKYGINKTFTYINKNQFLFDNKYNIIADINNNNEFIIEIEKNKYNLEEFISIYCKDDNKKEITDIRKDKEKFVYTRKRRFQQNKINNDANTNTNKQEVVNNEHQKKRRKRRIIDDDEELEEENNKKEEKENSSSNKKS